jgi:hypothetical protein
MTTMSATDSANQPSQALASNSMGIVLVQRAQSLAEEHLE